MAALADFHFLRPAWLLALLPCALLAFWFVRQRARPALWSELIDPALLAALLLPESAGRRNALPWLLLAGWALAVLGLAGPAWERLPEPVHRASDPLIIALDLGHTMRAGDLAPSRYERARFKLGDILARRQDGQTALIVYAGDAHVVTPLSDDARTLAAMLPALSPDIMPSAGNDLPAAVALAGSLLRGAGLERGRLLVVTDRFPAAQHAEVARHLEAAGLSLSLLATGTEAGAPIALPQGGFLRERDGSIVVPGVDLETMRDGVAAAGGRFATLSLDDSDIASLLPPPLATDIDRDDSVTRTFDRWQDRGAWLALALLPLAALAFRRGWLLGIALVLLLPQPRAEALEWQDMWLNKDQQGARAMSEQDPARAAGLFRSPAWRGTAQYEAGDYAGAAGSWAAQDDADAHYNRGNALARAGRLEEALAAYDAALAREPGMSDAAANRKLVDEALKQRQQQPDQDGRQQSGDQSQDGGEQQGQQGQQDQRQDGQSPADGRQQQSREGSQGGDGNKPPEAGHSQDGQGGKPGEASGADGEAQPDAPGKQAAQPGKQDQPQPGVGQGADNDGASADAAARAQAEAEAGNGEQDQAVEQWLRQVPDDPGALLRRKFEYEYRARREGAPGRGM
jgi:Ca-activated chloride channel family protein